VGRVLEGLLDAAARLIEFPAVVLAANTVLFDDAVGE
jgi:hypothetical protein